MNRFNYVLDFESGRVIDIVSRRPQSTETLLRISEYLINRICGEDGKVSVDVLRERLAECRRMSDQEFTVDGCDPEDYVISVDTPWGRVFLSHGDLAIGDNAAVSVLFRRTSGPVLLCLKIPHGLNTIDRSSHKTLFRAVRNACVAAGKTEWYADANVPGTDPLDDIVSTLLDAQEHDEELLCRHGIYGVSLDDYHTPIVEYDPSASDEPVLYEQVVILDDGQADMVEKWLDNTVHQDEDETFTVTARFPDGRQMDIKCCGVQDQEDGSWTEAVLFEPGGREICCAEPDETFQGVWEIEADGICYRAHVFAKEPLTKVMQRQMYAAYRIAKLAELAGPIASARVWESVSGKDRSDGTDEAEKALSDAIKNPSGIPSFDEFLYEPGENGLRLYEDDALAKKLLSAPLYDAYLKIGGLDMA